MTTINQLQDTISDMSKQYQDKLAAQNHLVLEQEKAILEQFDQINKLRAELKDMTMQRDIALGIIAYEKCQRAIAVATKGENA